MRLAAPLLIAAACLAACSCSPSADPGRAPPPGYSGTVPSPAAQERFRAVLGKECPVGTAGVTEPGWLFVDFSVVPSDAAPGGKGPVVRIRKGAPRDSSTPRWGVDPGEIREIFVPDDAALDALTNAAK